MKSSDSTRAKSAAAPQAAAPQAAKSAKSAKPTKSTQPAEATPPGSRETVRVALAERSYDIAIGPGLLEGIGETLQKLRPTSRVVVITDRNVEPFHGRVVCDSIGDTGCEVELLAVDAGETTKSLSQAESLWEKLYDLGADRKTVVVALGGGVVGDLAGFVAAGYARGIPFLQVPTTLLAAVDSSVGGKTGVNLAKGKNMVGAFWQPLGVLVDLRTFRTLPEREYLSGLAEIVKYGVIQDAEFFEYLEKNTKKILARDDEALRHIIARSCRLKADVVEKDEREETGLRAILNYGHTFAHAFEAITNYEELLHGEAVAMGMHSAARLADRLGRIDDVFVARQERLLKAFKLPLEPPVFSGRKILALMARDKKAENGQLNFVLPTRLGHVELVRDVPGETVLEILEG